MDLNFATVLSVFVSQRRKSSKSLSNCPLWESAAWSLPRRSSSLPASWLSSSSALDRRLWSSAAETGSSLVAIRSFASDALPFRFSFCSSRLPLRVWWIKKKKEKEAKVFQWINSNQCTNSKPPVTTQGPNSLLCCLRFTLQNSCVLSIPRFRNLTGELLAVFLRWLCLIWCRKSIEASH